MLISDFRSDEEGTAGKGQDAVVGHNMVRVFHLLLQFYKNTTGVWAVVWNHFMNTFQDTAFTTY